MSGVAVTAAAEAPGGEKKDETDDGEADDGFLRAASTDRETRIHSNGGDHDVHVERSRRDCDFFEFSGDPLQGYYGGTLSA
jgi:hypothetical protein